MLKQSFETISEALANGKSCASFRRGITRDGKFNEFRAGIERIVARNPAPVVRSRFPGSGELLQPRARTGDEGNPAVDLGARNASNRNANRGSRTHCGRPEAARTGALRRRPGGWFRPLKATNHPGRRFTRCLRRVHSLPQRLAIPIRRRSFRGSPARPRAPFRSAGPHTRNSTKPDGHPCTPNQSCCGALVCSTRGIVGSDRVFRPGATPKYLGSASSMNLCRMTPLSPTRSAPLLGRSISPGNISGMGGETPSYHVSFTGGFDRARETDR